jgi:NitT/TauT family transport system permease protein
MAEATTTTPATRPEGLPVPRRGSTGRWLKRALKATAPLIALIALLALWQILVVVLDVRPFILPKPTEIAVEIYEERVILWDATMVTLLEVVLGFLLSIAVAIPLAILIVYSSFFKNVFYPLLVTSQAVPRIAVAPLVVLWFGFGILPKVLVAFSIAFFPLVVNTAIGLESTKREIVYVVRSMGGSSLQTFMKARFPSALPSIFGGLKVAIALSVIGAIVGEFVGASEGLGYLVIAAQGNLNTDLIFASITIMAIMGIVLFYVIELVERMVIGWHYAARAMEEGGGLDEE